MTEQEMHDAEVACIIHLKHRFGIGSIARLLDMVMKSRHDEVMQYATQKGLRIVKVVYFPWGGRSYETFNRIPDRKLTPVSEDPGVRILNGPWESPFEEDPGFIRSEN